jgi:carbon monoxide dehydrogenase subunit G
MELKATYSFSIAPARLWNSLMDPGVIASCLPGCQKFEPIGEDEYRVVMQAAVAAIGGSFGGTVRIADKQPPQSYRLIVDGSGSPGFAKGESIVTLRETPSGADVDVHATITIGGLVAQVGQRLLGVTGKMMMDRFFNCLKSKIES